jgi:lipoprotein-anchoring transpeptidase ErfK/SrfK
VSDKIHPFVLAISIAATYSLGAAIAFSAEPNPITDLGTTDSTILSDSEALRVVAPELLLRQNPSLTAKRRGTLRRGTEVWAAARVVTADCPWGWLLIGPAAWACDADNAFEGRHNVVGSPKNEPLTLGFAKIGANGAVGYSTWAKVQQGLPDAELQPGYLVGLIEDKIAEPDRYYRSTHGIYFLANEAEILRPSAFAGRLLDDIAPVEGLSPFLPVGWVYATDAKPRSKPNGPVVNQKIPRLTEVRVFEQILGKDKIRWFRTHLGWLSSKQLRVPSISEFPEAARANGQYIDIDTDTQTLVAYRNHRPWFITLVSTGQGNTPTPIGEYRIWAKLLYSDMDNLDEFSKDDSFTPEEKPYAVEAVPWVMFFSGGYGIHATYWHHEFGTKKSHGCVNLSVADAERIFNFVGPRLNEGWQAAHPSDYDPGTVIRIR